MRAMRATPASFERFVAGTSSISTNAQMGTRESHGDLALTLAAGRELVSGGGGDIVMFGTKQI